MKSLTAALAMIVVILALNPPADAQFNKTWSAPPSGSGQWNVPENWDPNGVPLSTDSVLIDNELCRLDTSQVVASLRIRPKDISYAPYLQFGYDDPTAQLDVNGAVELQDNYGASFRYSQMDVYGTLYCNLLAVDPESKLRYYNGTVIVDGGAIYPANPNLLVVEGALSGYHGTLVLSQYAYQQNFTEIHVGTQANQYGTLRLNSSENIQTSALHIGTDSQAKGTLELDGGANLYCSGSMNNIGTQGQADISIQSSSSGWTVDNASGTMGSAGTVNLTIASGGAWTINELNGDVQIGGESLSNDANIDIHVTGSDSQWMVTESGSDLQLLGSSLAPAGTGTTRLSISDGGTVNLPNLIIGQPDTHIQLDSGPNGAGELIVPSLSLNANTSLTGQGGQFIGTLHNSEGLIAPGSDSSSATLNIDGDYNQNLTGQLIIDIYSDPAAGDFDVLAVTGQASLGGELVLVFTDPTPAIGSEYTFLTAGSITGQFDSLSVSGLDPSRHIDYAMNSGSFIVVPEPTTFALMGLSGVTLLARRLRPRRSKDKTVVSSRTNR